MWASARVGVTIDGTLISDTLPVMWFLGVAAQPSGVIHYPVIAGADNRMYRGHHTLLMRTVD